MKTALLSCLAFASSLFAKPVTPQMLQEVDAKVRQFSQHQKGGGVAVTIIYGEGFEGHQQKNFMYGHAKGRESAAPTNENIFYLASITKVLTSTVLAKFVQEGKVKLDDPAQKYVPKWVKVPSYRGREITLRDLATHTSALPREAGGVEHPYHYEINDFYRWLSNYKLNYAPGTKTVYSNLGYGFLGLILATVANTTYADLVIREVCNPLGMDDTRTWDTYTDAQRERFCEFYSRDGSPVKTGCCNTLPALGGAGDFASTLSDMTKFLAYNMGLTSSMNDLLPLLQNHDFTMGANHFIGLGWYNNPLYAKGTIMKFSKNGGLPGVSTYIAFVKETKTGVVVLANTNSEPTVALGNQILQILNPK